MKCSVKKDCYAYKDKKCVVLNELYCCKGKCNFYNSRLNWKDIHKSISDYNRRVKQK